MPRKTGKFHDQIVLFESNLLIICGINFFPTVTRKKLKTKNLKKIMTK